jgi:hypothetical protein
MSTLTNNLKLNKPEETEHYNVTTQNTPILHNYIL